MKHAACPICGEDSDPKLDLSPSPVAAQMFSRSPRAGVRDGLSVFECLGCQHIFLCCEPVEYYRSVVRSTSVSETMKRFRYEQGEQLAKLSRPWLGSRPRIFEVGAHQNENLEIFRQIGFETYGCEYLDGTGEFLSGDHSVWDISLDEDSDSELIPEAGYFDVVCSFNFLEHFQKPQCGAAAIYELLKPGGFALLEVPNFDHIASAGLISEFIADHLHYFSRKSFSRLLVDSGFSIHRIDSIFSDYILSAVVEKNVSVDWALFLKQRALLFEDLVRIGETAKRSMKPLFLWGCGHQSMFMLVHFDLTYFFTAIIDSSDQKIGKFPLGIGLEVVPPSVLASHKAAFILVCAGGFNAEIISQVRSLNGDYEVFEVMGGTIKSAR